MRTFSIAAFSFFIIFQMICFNQAVPLNDFGQRILQTSGNISMSETFEAIKPEKIKFSEIHHPARSLSDVPLLTDLSHLSFIIINNVCRDVSNVPILAVMLVTSHVGNIDRRNAIRAAYNTSELASIGIRRVFMLASLVNDTEPNLEYKSISQNSLIQENTLNEDILLIDLIEAYTNLTYKILMGLKYATTYCTAAQFVIKVDDDTLYDVYQLAEVFKSVTSEDRDTLEGDKQYKKREFLTGFLYFTSIRTAALLLETSKLIPYVPEEDVFITGITADVAGVKRHEIDGLSRRTLSCCRDVANNVTYRCEAVAALRYRFDEELLLKISGHSTYCHYNNGCNQKSDHLLYPSDITCF